jgi:TRAP-type C4-dicarboxylate transport system permease small subunit
VDRALDRLSRFAAGLAAAAFFIIGLIVAYEVVMRYVFLAPSRWAEEVAQILQIYAVFLGAAWLTVHRQQIRITVLADRVGPSARRWLDRLALLVAAAVSIAGAWTGAQLIAFSIETGQRTDTTLELPMALVQAPVPVGLALVAVAALVRLAQSFRAGSG